MGFFSRWLKKSPVSVAQKFSESPVNISQVAQLPIDWFGAGVYEREAAVRTVIDHIARNIASMPFKVYIRQSDGDRVEDTTSPLAQLMAKPSVLPGMTRYRFFYSLLCDGLLNDRWLCLLDANRQSGRLWLRRKEASISSCLTRRFCWMWAIARPASAVLRCPALLPRFWRRLVRWPNIVVR